MDVETRRAKLQGYLDKLEPVVAAMNGGLDAAREKLVEREKKAADTRKQLAVDEVAVRQARRELNRLKILCGIPIRERGNGKGETKGGGGDE
jgi:hypothetical protein